MNKLTLVKYDWDSFPEDWRIKSHANVNPYKDMVFAFFGEITQMKEHGYYQEIYTGETYILHIDSMIALTEDEA